jgi:DNA-binding PadR family transcriptional regulator
MVTYMNDVESRLPLRDPTFFILLSLAPGPKHGYAILKEVEALSEGRLKLSTGTLYGAIKRMLDDGWIERVDDWLPSGRGRKRKPYALSERGRRLLKVEIERLRKLVAVAQMQTAEESL